MAIKPTDTVIWLDKAGYFEDEPDWNGYWHPVYHYPKYWTNFVAHATRNIPKIVVGKNMAERKKQAKAFKEQPKIHDDAIDQHLKTYSAEWKICKQGEYLKFKDTAQMTMFMLKWS